MARDGTALAHAGIRCCAMRAAAVSNVDFCTSRKDTDIERNVGFSSEPECLSGPAAAQ